MTDVVVTVPKWFWPEWIEEGQLPGDAEGGEDWGFYLGGSVARPYVKPGERIYIVAHGKLRGYAPLTRIDVESSGRYALVRNGGAEAVTIAEPIRGFRGWRYRWWDQQDEQPFPE